MVPAALLLLKELEPRCRAVAAKFFRPGDADFDDYCQAALIGAWKGLIAYDSTRSPDPRGFALRCARREVMNALTVRRRKREECILDAPLPDSPDGGLSLAGAVAGTAPDPAEVVIAREILAEIWARLSPVERLALFMKASGFTLAEIGRALGRGHKAAANAIARARRKALRHGRDCGRRMSAPS